jgi:hypothetical protein
MQAKKWRICIIESGWSGLFHCRAGKVQVLSEKNVIPARIAEAG